MDNVVQNINIEDIIPSDFQATTEENNKIEELAQLIKTFGLIDPIVVRPKNNKYEIVLGIEKYQASKIAGLKKIPAIIKEIDDEAFLKYLKIDTQQKNHQNSERKDIPNQKNVSNNDFPIPLEKENNTNNFPNNNWKIKNSNENSDIINLSELNQEEYERKDFKMNNEQLNNITMNNGVAPTPAVNPQPQAPTFGGSFFPSLEDEPTNMNMTASQPVQPPVVDTPNNNLIDLTDLSIEKEPIAAPDFTTVNSGVQPSIPEPNTSINNVQLPQNDFELPNSTPTSPAPTAAVDSIINLENLQNNNQATQPIPEPTPMATLNADFGAPMPTVTPTPAPTVPEPNQFDIPQTMAPATPPVPELNPNINNIEMPQNDFGMPTPTITPQPEVASIPSQPVQEPIPMATLNADFGVSTPAAMPTPPVSSTPTFKDITPVTNTIKNLVTSLEAFGYKININEEELPTTVKLTIEVEK